jgi:hypothetical protein
LIPAHEAAGNFLAPDLFLVQSFSIQCTMGYQAGNRQIIQSGEL